MTEPSENYEPTEADLDLVLEDATGKPVRPENLAAGIASLKQRIAQLETEKAELLGRMEKNSDASHTEHLTAINRHLASARERLAHYEVQSARQN